MIAYLATEEFKVRPDQVDKGSGRGYFDHMVRSYIYHVQANGTGGRESVAHPLQRLMLCPREGICNTPAEGDCTVVGCTGV